MTAEGNALADLRADKASLKQKDARDALRLVPYGLYVLTTAHDGRVNAITCNWVTQVSFKPLLIAVAIEKQSQTHQLLRGSGVFAINFLDKEQKHLARQMAIPYRLKPHKLAGIPYHADETGAPLLDEAIGYLECEVSQVLEVVGDHTLFIGQVVAGGAVRHVEPLTLLHSGLRYK